MPLRAGQLEMSLLTLAGLSIATADQAAAGVSARKRSRQESLWILKLVIKCVLLDDPRSMPTC